MRLLVAYYAKLTASIGNFPKISPKREDPLSEKLWKIKRVFRILSNIYDGIFGYVNYFREKLLLRSLTRFWRSFWKIASFNSIDLIAVFSFSSKVQLILHEIKIFRPTRQNPVFAIYSMITEKVYTLFEIIYILFIIYLIHFIHQNWKLISNKIKCYQYLPSFGLCQILSLVKCFFSMEVFLVVYKDWLF